MIQVLERISRIMDIISGHPEGVALKQVEDLTGLNKGTVCNLLRSLCDIGYAQKKKSGIYSIGPKLLELAYPALMKHSLINIAALTLRGLVQESGEGGMIAVQEEGQLRVIAKELSDQSVVLNTNLFESLPGYNTAIGHIFLAFDRSLDVPSIFSTQLAKRYRTKKEMGAVLEHIRAEGSFILSLHDGDACALAVPVFQGKEIAAGLAVLIPAIRFNEEKKATLLALTLQAAEKMSAQLSQGIPAQGVQPGTARA